MSAPGQPGGPRFLNLGCGPRYSRDAAWTNVDFVSTGPGVLAHNLLDGIPFPDASFDAVYHSHVLEHFRRADGARFLAECHRVLRPGGVLRVVVPDLETICRLYLTYLEGAAGGDPAAAARHEWMTLELLDQVVRTEPGGEMARHLRRSDVPEREFIVGRVGNVARQIMANAAPTAGAWVRRLGRARTWRRALSILPGVPERARRAAAGAALGPADRAAMRLGHFRLGGEVHQWMYDRVSLVRLLGDTGFVRVAATDAATSAIPHWAGYALDVDPDGTEHAPSSLYVEGVRPRA